MKPILLAVAALLALAPASEARAKRADLAIAQVTVGTPKDGRATVRFTVENRGTRRSHTATVNATIGKARATLHQKPLKPHRRQRRTLTVKGLQPGTWPVAVCARPHQDRSHKNDCARLAKPLSIAGPAPQPAAPPQPGLGASPNLHVNAAHTASIDIPSFAPPLHAVWDIDASHPLHALVADGRIFVVERHAPNDPRGLRIRALDPATGATLWSHDILGPANGAAAYDRGRVFVAGGSLVVALDAATGAQQWVEDFGDNTILAPPTADNGELYVVDWSTIIRYDEVTGAHVWTAKPATYTESSLAVSLDATRVIGTCGSYDRATGRSLTPFQNCPQAYVPLAPLYNNHLLLGTHDGLEDIDTSTGAAGTGAGVFPPAVLGDTAVVGEHVDGENLGITAYTMPGWVRRWHSQEQSPYSLGLPPLIVGRYVYWASTSGIVRAVDLATGLEVWSDALPFAELMHYTQEYPISMSFGDGLLLVPGQDSLSAYAAD